VKVDVPFGHGLGFDLWLFNDFWKF
jgi:hypothetical protein